MTDRPMDLIEKYLERVRIYLPLGNEDILDEIRTHLIEEAERLGQGRLTHGSVLLAIERFGDPKDAANAYAGTGRRIGPIPVEYSTAMLRLVLLLIVLGTLFVVGAAMIGNLFSDLLGTLNFEYSIVTVVVVSLFYAFLIIGGLSYMDRSTAVSEKTFIERILGIGSDAFKPKPLSDAVAELIFCICLLLLLVSPMFQWLIYPEWRFIIYPAILLSIGDLIKSLLFVLVGENNVNLVIEAVMGTLWVLLCMFLINISFPLMGIPAFFDNQWTIVMFSEIQQVIPHFKYIRLDIIWIFIILVIVLTSLWETLVASMKIPMYLSAGKGWWWRGKHGQRRWRKYHPAKWSDNKESSPGRQPASNY